MTLRGDGLHNDLIVSGCVVRIYGGGGDDVINQTVDGTGAIGKCSVRTTKIYGGPGNDFMKAYAGDDVLIGGPGRDYAFGGGGTDRCVAERRAKCER